MLSRIQKHYQQELLEEAASRERILGRYLRRRGAGHGQSADLTLSGLSDDLLFRICLRLDPPDVVALSTASFRLFSVCRVFILAQLAYAPAHPDCPRLPLHFSLADAAPPPSRRIRRTPVKKRPSSSSSSSIHVDDDDDDDDDDDSNNDSNNDSNDDDDDDDDVEGSSLPRFLSRIDSAPALRYPASSAVSSLTNWPLPAALPETPAQRYLSWWHAEQVRRRLASPFPFSRPSPAFGLGTVIFAALRNLIVPAQHLETLPVIPFLLHQSILLSSSSSSSSLSSSSSSLSSSSLSLDSSTPIVSSSSSSSLSTSSSLSLYSTSSSPPMLISLDEFSEAVSARKAALRELGPSCQSPQVGDLRLLEHARMVLRLVLCRQLHFFVTGLPAAQRACVLSPLQAALLRALPAVAARLLLFALEAYALRLHAFWLLGDLDAVRSELLVPIIPSPSWFHRLFPSSYSSSSSYTSYSSSSSYTSSSSPFSFLSSISFSITSFFSYFTTLFSSHPSSSFSSSLSSSSSSSSFSFSSSSFSSSSSSPLYRRTSVLYRYLRGVGRIPVPQLLVGLSLAVAEELAAEGCSYYCALRSAGVREVPLTQLFCPLPSHRAYRTAFSAVRLLTQQPRINALTGGLPGVAHVAPPSPAALLAAPSAALAYLLRLYDANAFLRSLLHFALTAPLSHAISYIELAGLRLYD